MFVFPILPNLDNRKVYIQLGNRLHWSRWACWVRLETRGRAPLLARNWVMLVRGVVRMTVGLSERRVCKQTRTVSMQFTSKKIVCHEAYFSKSSHSKALWSKAFLSGSWTTNSTLALLRIVRCENRQSSHLASTSGRCESRSLSRTIRFMRFCQPSRQFT